MRLCKNCYFFIICVWFYEIVHFSKKSLCMQLLRILSQVSLSFFFFFFLAAVNLTKGCNCPPGSSSHCNCVHSLFHSIFHSIVPFHIPCSPAIRDAHWYLCCAGDSYRTNYVHFIPLKCQIVVNHFRLKIDNKNKQSVVHHHWHFFQEQQI